jgi:hypothetical protein
MTFLARADRREVFTALRITWHRSILPADAPA